MNLLNENPTENGDENDNGFSEPDGGKYFAFLNAVRN